MELTPQLLETQQFPEKWRGYDQDAVDEFLERVGVGLAELQDRLRAAAARVKELEAAGASDAPAPAAAAAPEPSAATSPGTTGDASAVARALVLAQEAADRTIAEARAEAERLTAAARVDADALLREAEAEHAEAVAKLADADAHVEALAEDALRDARAEAARLVSDAEQRAADITASARAEADRLTSSATELAERHADEVAARRNEELVELDAQISSRRREVIALRTEITDRQRELREVVEGLQNLVGRVGSLAGSDEQTATPAASPIATSVPSTAETAPPAPAEPAAPVDESTAPLDEPMAIADTRDAGDDHHRGTDQTDQTDETDEAVVIDLTSDDARVEHAASEQSAGAATGGSAPGETPMPKWATVEQPLTPSAGRRGLTVVSDAEAEAAPVAVVELDELAPRTEDDDEAEEMTVTRVRDEAPASDAAATTSVIDDPFLAALRGPDRVEFDDDAEPDVERSSFKRRRRRRL